MKVEILHVLRAHKGAVYRLLKDADQKNLFYSSGSDGQIIQWDLRQSQKAFLVANIRAQIFSMAQLEGGAFFLLGQMQGNLHVIDRKAKKEIKNITFHHNGIFDICPIESKNIFLTAGGDGILGVWDAKNFALLQHKKVSDKSLRCIDINAAQDLIYIGSSDNAVHVINIKTLETLQTITAHQNSIFDVTLSPDNMHLLSGARDAHLNLWSTQPQLQLLKSLPAHLFTINSIIFHPEGKYLATSSRDKHIKIWSYPELHLLKVVNKEKFDAHTHSVNHLIWMENLISCSDDGSIRIWQIENDRD